MDDDFLTLETYDIEMQRITHHEMSKKDGKGLFLIYKCLNSNILENIVDEKHPKVCGIHSRSCMEVIKKLKNIKM